MRRWSGRRPGDECRRRRRAMVPGANFERLERREVPAAIDFGMAIGIGASGNYADIRANAVASDAAGNILVTGSFAASAGFDPGAPATLTTASGSRDLFVAKYTPTGALAWARTFPGQATAINGQATRAVAQGSALAVDGSGNLFVSGTFSGTVDFDPGAGVTALSSPGRTDAFVLKLDGAGNLAWARDMAEAPADVAAASAIAPDGSGGVYIGGSFQETMTFGTSTLTAGGLSDAFVARLDGAGQFRWAVATRGAGTSGAEARGLAVDPAGNVVAAGSLAGSADFDPGPGVTTLASNGSYDAAVWKISPAGQLLWARGIGGADYDQANAVACDASGNAYVTGTFSLAADFGTSGKADTLVAGGYSDVFVAKVAGDGSEAWSRSFVGSPGSFSQGRGIAVDAIGRVHVAGSFQGSVDFDPGPGVSSLASVGYSDAFVAGLAGDGSALYALRAGQSGSAAAMGVTVDASGFASVVGPYSGAAAFGPIAVPAVGTSRFFVARVASGTPPPASPAAPALQAGSDTGASATDRITAATSPRFDVVASSPSNLVKLLRDGVTVASRVGSGAVADPGPVADGPHAYSAVEVGPFGVASAAGAATTITIDTAAPAAPPAPALLVADDTGTQGDRVTSVRRPRLTGMVEPLATVQLLDASSAVVGSAVAGADGSYVVTTAATLGDGSFSFRVRAVDVAGNVGLPGASLSLTIDATAPATPPAPWLLAADDTGTPGDRMTTVRVPRIVGTAEAGAVVSWIAPNGSVVASTTATAAGSYTLAPPSALANGTYTIQVRATDAAGNVGGISPSFVLTIRATSGDLDGDGKADPLGFRGSKATFLGQYSASGKSLNQALGQAGDVPAVADYDGDGRADLAVFRPSNGTFTLIRSSTGASFSQAWGVSGDIAVPADYDGDGKADLAVFRPSNATFYVLNSATGSIYIKAWGVSGDVPIPADYDGDGKADLAVFRPSNATFYVINSATGTGYGQAWGAAGDVAVPADYDGDGKADLAVFRPSNATFYAQKTTTNSLWAIPISSQADRPALAPVMTWYPSGTSGAMQVASLLVASPEVGTTARVGSALALDRALQALDLERWRVGG